MKIYNLTIVYNDETEEVEYIEEEVAEESIKSYNSLDLEDYFDKEGMELIAGCYILGEA